LCYFFPSTDYVLILTKNALGHILCAFKANSSGHPAWHSQTVGPVLLALRNNVEVQVGDSQNVEKNIDHVEFT
jgi:hypothetical protein